MRRLFATLLVAVAVAACQDDPIPVAPADHLLPNASIASVVAEDFLVRWDAADPEVAAQGAADRGEHGGGDVLGQRRHDLHERHWWHP